MEVVWIAAKLTVKTRRVRFLIDRSSPLASSISHDNKSFCSDGSEKKVFDGERKTDRLVRIIGAILVDIFLTLLDDGLEMLHASFDRLRNIGE